MFSKKTIYLLLIMMIVSQPIVAVTIESRTTNLPSQQIKYKNLPQNKDLYTTQAVGGEDYLKTNILNDGGFERTGEHGGPIEFSHYGDGYTIVNNSYRDIQYGGIYASLTSSKGTIQYSSYAYNYKYLPSSPQYPSLTEQLYVDFWYNPYTNPDLMLGGQIYFYINIYSGTNHYLYYYFSRNQAINSNSSNYAYFDLRDSLNSWFHFSRNITNDFVEAFGSVVPGHRLQEMEFISFSPSEATGFVNLVIDDVSVTNDTAYEYIINGDFELGNSVGWSDHKTGPASSFIINNDKTEGMSSLNMTASAYYQNSNSYSYVEKSLYSDSDVYYKGYYGTNPEKTIIKFDWKYSDIMNGGTNQYSNFYLHGYNGTFTYYFIFYLGRYNDMIGSINVTYPSYAYYYFAAPGFGTRDTWQTFSLDMYDISLALGGINFAIHYMGFQTAAGNNQNSTVQLLIDDFNFITYPTADPSFEEDWAWSPNDPLISWYCNDDHNYQNITTDAHIGVHAANITAHSDCGSSYARRRMNLPINHNLYLDFWWKITEMTSHSNTHSYISLELNSSYNIYYIIGGSATNSFSNYSGAVYYFVEGFNTTNIWHNLVRDVEKDAFLGLGLENLFVTAVYLYCYVGHEDAVATTIFDDIHFVRDTTPPDILSVDLQNDPTYYVDYMIDISAIDILHDIVEVIINYQNGTAWYQTLAEPIAEGIFRGFIPKSSFGVSYNYSVEVFDTAGVRAIDNNSGLYYSFTIIDDINPILSVYGPQENTQVSNGITFYMEGNDVGSGINSFIVKIENTTLYENQTLPNDFTWDSTQIANGEYTLFFILEDNAGNSIEIQKVYNVQNIAPILRGLSIFFNWGTLLGAGIVALGFGIFFLVRLIKVKKA